MNRSHSLLTIATLALSLFATACSTNEAATKKCKADQDCAACCKANGASGHAKGTINGKYSCKCMGG